MNRVSMLSAVLIVALVGACSGSDGDADADARRSGDPSATSDSGSPSPSPTTPTPTGQATPTEGGAGGDAGQRDTQVTRVGETANAVESADGVPSVEFVVDEIAVDGTCTSGSAEAPERGHMLVVSLTMTTSPELVEVTLTPTIDVNRSDFTIVGSDGRTEADNGTMAAFTCLAESDAMPIEVGPGQTIAGKIA
ncbi:MAG: hypothetical protein ACRD0W_14395, partial [Acidimicrobiales bacterium]